MFHGKFHTQKAGNTWEKSNDILAAYVAHKHDNFSFSSGIIHSAPGKVLICGGHLILDPVNKGVSFPFGSACVSAKSLLSFSIDVGSHILRPSQTPYSLAFFYNGAPFHLDITSTIAIYKEVQFSPLGSFTLTSFLFVLVNGFFQVFHGSIVIDESNSTDITKNCTINLNDVPPLNSLSFDLLVILSWIVANEYSLLSGPILFEIETITDSSFYISPPASYHSKLGIPLWGKSLKTLIKSGLGSSAAFVTAVTLSLSQHSLTSSRLVHQDLTSILSQALVSHWIGQEFKGSGFDICTSLANSTSSRPLYLIFSQSTSVIKALSEYRVALPHLEKMRIAFRSLHKAVSQWEISTFPVPPHLQLAILTTEKNIGTSTTSVIGASATSMVDISSELHESWVRTNENLVSFFTQPENLYSFDKLSILYSEYRKNLQRIPNKGSCLEPLCFTEMLDFLQEQIDTLIAGVPGAGGFDSVFALYERGSGITDVIRLWNEREMLRVEILSTT